MENKEIASNQPCIQYILRINSTNFIKKVILSVLMIALTASSLVPTTYATSSSISSYQSPIQYRITARLDEKDMIIQGSQTVTYRNTSKDSLKELVMHTYADANRSKATQTNVFQRQNEQIAKEHPEKKGEDFLGGIDILEVNQQGQNLLFNNENQALNITLKTPLEPDQSITFQVSYRLKIPFGMQRISYYNNQVNGAHWFPVMSVYDEDSRKWNMTPYSTSFESDFYTSSDFNVELNVPESYEVAMPGVLGTGMVAEAGRKIVTANAENTREFVFFASPKLKVERITRHGLTVEYFYVDNAVGKKELVQKYIDQVFKVMDFFNEKYGQYPYPDFRIVESSVKGVAIEYSRLIQMGQIKMDASPEKDSMFVHEIAHQWFHALIGNDSETESFLDEGFADFSKVYFAEKQGDKLNGFKSIQFNPSSVGLPIASTNKEAGDLASLIFYQKGRQAIYQLYRSVGEQQFDVLMKQYFKRYVYQNATINGWLDTIENVLGKEQREEMQTVLFQPNFELKPEYQLTKEETIAFVHDKFQLQYETVMKLVTDLPYEVMNRLMDKLLQGEKVTIVLSDGVSDAAAKQQEAMVSQLTSFLDLSGLSYDVIRDRTILKQKSKKQIANSNLILIGNAQSNGIVQELKSKIIYQSSKIGLDWNNTMKQKLASGAYVIKHPYNDNRLMLHYYWNADHLSEAAFQPYMMMLQSSISFSSDYYQYYMLDNQGREVNNHKINNPLADFFGDE